MSLKDKLISASYKDVLQVDNSNNGVGSSLLPVKDGDGNRSAVSISDDNVLIQPVNDDTSTALEVKGATGTTLLVGTGADARMKWQGHHILTHTQEFNLSSYLASPSSTDTWTAITPSGTRPQAGFENGTANTSSFGDTAPATSYTVSSNADDIVNMVWIVPADITIQSCKVYYGADTATGDDAVFSLNSYNIDISNSSTGGDLALGVQNCVSPSVVSAAGYTTMLYQNLTVSTADVNSGRAIIAYMAIDTNNSDYSVKFQLKYFYR